MSVIRMGHRDPSLIVSDSAAQLCLMTPQGPVSIGAVQQGRRLQITGYGEGSPWTAARYEALFGLKDRPETFQPTGKMKRLADRLRGLHLPHLPVVFPRLLQIVLLQLVTWSDAFRAWQQLLFRWGSDTPGPYRLRLPPPPEKLKSLAYYDLVACGILPKQARLILRLAGNAPRIERLSSDPQALSRYLLGFPGVGEWTVQYLLGSALGQADAVLPGDYNLPHTVSWYLAGRERGSDKQMLELLEPYRGHRFRVISLLLQSGIRAPRRGPRVAGSPWRGWH